jgi:hypothetical protein
VIQPLFNFFCLFCSYAAGEIQRCFRGLMGRKKAKKEAHKKRTTRQLHYINYLVIQLQRCFRGYYSRKYKRDHAKRKQYARMIAEKGEEVLNKMKQYAFEQTEVRIYSLNILFIIDLEFFFRKKQKNSK